MTATLWAPEDRTRTTVATAAAVAAALLIGRYAAGGRFGVVALGLLGVAGVAVTLHRPKWGTVVLLILTGSLFPSRFGGFDVAGIRSDVPEALLFGLLGMWLLHQGLQRHLEGGRILYPLFGFVAAGVFGAAVALGRGAGLSEVLGPLKTFAFWLLVLPILAVVQQASDIEWLERIVLRIAVAGSVVTLMLALGGQGVPTGEVAGVTSLGVISDVTRYRPALLQLAFLATLLVAHRGAMTGWSLRRVTAMAVLLLVQVISFNRSTWVALVVSLALYGICRPGIRKPLRGLSVALLCVTVIASGVLAGGAGILGPSAKAIALRARSVVTPTVFEERSQQLRNEENEAAMSAIRRRPITGTGLNQPFGARVGRYSHDAGMRLYSDNLLVHNTYLKIWLETGLPGLLGLAALGATVWTMTRKHLRHLSPHMASRSLAAALCLLGFAMQALYQTKLYHRPTIVAIAVSIGLIAATDRLSSEPADVAGPSDR